MHTNPFNPVYPLREYMEPQSAGWRTGGPLTANIKYSLPFGKEAHGTYINIPMTLRLGSPGGLKGCMVPGDAHPYLVPYRDLVDSQTRDPHFY